MYVNDGKNSCLLNPKLMGFRRRPLRIGKTCRGSRTRGPLSSGQPCEHFHGMLDRKSRVLRRLLKSEADRLHNLRCMDTVPLLGPEIAFAVLPEDIHDSHSTSAHCDLNSRGLCRHVGDCFVHRFHPTVPARPLFLGSVLPTGRTRATSQRKMSAIYNTPGRSDDVQCCLGFDDLDPPRSRLVAPPNALGEEDRLVFRNFAGGLVSVRQRIARLETDYFHRVCGASILKIYYAFPVNNGSDSSCEFYQQATYEETGAE